MLQLLQNGKAREREELDELSYFSPPSFPTDVE